MQPAVGSRSARQKDRISVAHFLLDATGKIQKRVDFAGRTLLGNKNQTVQSLYATK